MELKDPNIVIKEMVNLILEILPLLFAAGLLPFYAVDDKIFFQVNLILKWRV